MKTPYLMKGKLIATTGALALACVSSSAFAASYNANTYYPETNLSYNTVSPGSGGYAPSTARYNNENYTPYNSYGTVDPSVDDSIDVQRQGNVTFVTGGVGDEEKAVFSQIRRDYNLHLMNSGRDGGFTGDTNVRIFDKSGNEVVNAIAGPLFYAQLPRGSYTVEVTNQGVIQKKNVSVSSPNSKDINFIWNEFAHVN